MVINASSYCIFEFRRKGQSRFNAARNRGSTSLTLKIELRESYVRPLPVLPGFLSLDFREDVCSQLRICLKNGDATNAYAYGALVGKMFKIMRSVRRRLVTWWRSVQPAGPCNKKLCTKLCLRECLMICEVQSAEGVCERRTSGT